MTKLQVLGIKREKIRTFKSVKLGIICKAHMSENAQMMCTCQFGKCCVIICLLLKRSNATASWERQASTLTSRQEPRGKGECESGQSNGKGLDACTGSNLTTVETMARQTEF